MTQVLWQRYKNFLCQVPSLGFSLDLSRMNFTDDFFTRMEPAIQRAFIEMAALERGAIANPDEKRMVGHYWLRDAKLAPNGDIRQAIERNFVQIRSFSEEVHLGRLQGDGGKFTDMIVVGIGGSILGPQFVAAALGSSEDRLHVHFFDNTDPDGMDRTLGKVGDRLGQTLVIVISKSGGTPETRNGMRELEKAYADQKLNFARHAVAITGAGSELENHAKHAGWVARLPMWDWVGGRTSELSAVGLLPAALQGIDCSDLLAGAAAMDEATRSSVTRENPAALLALMWWHATDGSGKKDMVILPYKDRLELFSRYLQQLVMESLGKEYDRDRQIVHQGIAVYGNKGSTDQHAYVQQLREGVANFFVTFIEVLKDRTGASVPVDGQATTGDYLSGYLQGTRQALYENGRESMTLTISDVTPRTVGMLIALYERAVGFYASLVNVNAYHQPGVEAGKKAANRVLELQTKALAYLAGHEGFHTLEAIAAAIQEDHDIEILFKILQHATANPDHGITVSAEPNLFERVYARSKTA